MKTLIRPFGPIIEIPTNINEESKKKKYKIDHFRRKRISIIFALERVLNFCNMHLSLPGTQYNKKMLQTGKIFAINSLNYLNANQDKDDIPISLFLPDSYLYIVRSLELINVETVGDFIPYWKSPTERANLRRAWNISVARAPHPTFLGCLVPRNGNEIYQSN